MMLEGKVGVVTGATAGLGRAAAFAMAREGAAVVITGRDPAEGDPMVAKIRELGGRAIFETVDVIDEAANTFRVRCITVDEILQHGQIIGAHETVTDGLLTVPARASNLLGIVLQTLGQIVVIDVADVGLVDAHAKSDGRHHNGRV